MTYNAFLILGKVAIILAAGFYIASAGSDKYLAGWLADISHIKRTKDSQSVVFEAASTLPSSSLSPSPSPPLAYSFSSYGIWGLSPLAVYTLLAALSILTVLASGCAFAEGGVRASRTLHSLCLGRLLHAPVTWFQRTPSGRIVSRFSSDLSIVDVKVGGCSGAVVQ